MSESEPVRELRGGRYAVLGTLGAGSQAETLDAVDKQDGRALAIKRFSVRGAKSWKEVELAEREAQVLSELSHPNLPVYVEHFEEDGALYLVMEKVEGEPLSALRKRRGALSATDVERLLRDADSALGYLHSHLPPIIHRDLKPGNVIRRPDGSFVFVDFGSVRDRLKPEGGSTVVGTFGYMAPEQFQGRALPASDVYAIGATVLTLITGEEPENLPHRGLAIDVRRALDGGAPAWLERALIAMLEPDPDRRASRILPLLDAESSPRARRSERAREREAWRAPGGGRDEARQARHAARRARHDARPERRAAWPAQRHGAPAPLAPLLLLGLMIARIVVWALFRAFLPMLLSLLSIFFGRELRRTALRCRQIGLMVNGGLVHAMAGVRGRLLSADPSGYAPNREQEQRFRVDADADRPLPDEEQEPSRNDARRKR
ncbi:MAG TPA: serine/threonine-protein kinase [Polyangiaceae bacterium]|jgi:hypothetical protein